MDKNPPIVLFIVHESSRTGAPLLLLREVSWLKENNCCLPVFLIKNKGPLDSAFRLLGSVLFYYEKSDTRGKNLGYKIIGRIRNNKMYRNLFLNLLIARVKFIKPRLIYSNTISNGEVLEVFKKLGVPVVTHVHELINLINQFGDDNLDKVQKYSDFFIACSEYVRRTLISDCNVNADKITTIYSSIPENYGNDMGEDLQIDQDFYHIGGSGAIGWLKGTDFIIPLVKELLIYNNNFKFTWVGGDEDSVEFKDLKNEIKDADLLNIITITGSVKEPINHFRRFDVFVLLSREDSMGLVCLENAMLNKPVLCFEDSGGAVELLADFPNNIIPAFDIKLMAQRIVVLLADKSLREFVGKSLKNRVLKNYTQEIAFPLVKKVIEDHILKPTLSK